MDKQDITVEFIEYPNDGTKELFDRLLKLHGKPVHESLLEFPPCKLNGMLVKLGIPDLKDESHIKQLTNDVLRELGLDKVQTSDGKITIEQICE